MGPQCQDRSYPRESCRPRLLGGGLRLPGGRDRDREPTIGDNHTSRRVAVLRPLRYHNAGPLGWLPGETSCLTLVWAVLDRASRGRRGLTMTPDGLRLLQDLRRSLLDPPRQPGRGARQFCR
jgi:hypothetical protein